MFCSANDLQNESDVEQKFLWHFLTEPPPRGLGYRTSDIATKASIRQLEVDKGAQRRIHFPDYIVLLAGLPVLVVEAKRPAEAVESALEEARLYAAKLNEGFPTNINPCRRVIASNGLTTATTPADSNQIDYTVELAQVNVSNPAYAKLVDELCRKSLERQTAQLVERLTKRPLARPTARLGGQAVRNEEIGHNTFGSRLALDFRHVFSPDTIEDRAYLVRNAYVPSRRRERYVEPIDRLIRGITPPGIAHIQSIEDTGKSREIASALGRGKSLEHQVMLLVGGVGSGKSTYIDYLVNVALPQELLNRTVWVRLDMNVAPITEGLAHEWLMERLIDELRSTEATTDFDALENVRKIFSPEIQRLKKGPLSLLDEASTEYKTRLADALIRLQSDKAIAARSLARHLCGDRAKLLVVVLDNSDQRNRDDQLAMFRIAQWLQREFRCLVVLPIRDITYDHHRNEPPLDTAQKDLVFRIEPPRFSEVLSRRVSLALRELAQQPGEKKLGYTLPNGIRVEYPASDQGMYLASLLRSLYEHDRFLRRILSGLAGRNIRLALEMFVDFCASGHIGESEIFKIRQTHGDHIIPLGTVARALLRVNRRFYDGDKSYVKNVFQCHPEDPIPDHFARIAVLRTLNARRKENGPSGVLGFHRVESVVSTLSLSGHDADRVRSEVVYLLKEGCLVAEHQQADAITDDDLIAISPAGSVHLDLLGSIDYVAACAEDTWIKDPSVAASIAERIGSARGAHYSYATTISNAKDLLTYLEGPKNVSVSAPRAYLRDEVAESFRDLRVVAEAVDRAESEQRAASKDARVFVGNLSFDVRREEIMEAFAQEGFEVVDVHLPREADGGRGRGFAFVTLASGASVQDAITRLSRKLVNDRRIRLELADKGPTRPQRRDQLATAATTLGVGDSLESSGKPSRKP